MGSKSIPIVGSSHFSVENFVFSYSIALRTVTMCTARAVNFACHMRLFDS